MPVSSDQDIARILSGAHRVALLGASHKPERASHRVMRFLQAQGCEVIPVNPGLAGQTLLGCEVVAELADITAPVDMVDVFRNAHFLPAIVSEVIAARAPVMWTQLDVVDHAAAETAEAAGVEVVMDRCPAIEWPRLRRLGLLD
tara:strand:- start:100231 stop:100662 length:432 start_codon:yes stop_codon:yes gene_type:complete